MNDFEKFIKEKSNEELLQIVANSQDYQPEFIVLAHTELEEVRGITSETISEFVKSNTEKCDVKEEEIHGWLLFFMFAIGLGSLIAIFYNLYSVSFSDYDTEQGYAMQIFGFISDIILQVGIFAIAIYTIISFYRYKPNAIALANIYVISVFVTNLLGLLGGELESNGTILGGVNGAVRSLIWGIIWFIYLSQSEQVKTLFPKENRKLYKRDKIILVSIFTPFFIWLISVFSLAFGQAAMNEKTATKTVIEESSLTSNEYTDGRVAFTKPSEFTIEKQIQDEITFFSLTKIDNTVSITICSDFDNNDNQDYFNDCMEGWKDDSFTNYKSEITVNNHYNKDGNSVYIKTLKYDYEPIVYWTFALVFNKDTYKVLILNSYSSDEMYQIDNLLKSLRFR